ncbi:hypothetical protein [Photorhabdus australis]|uniref:hypothetical protein n=1 Tax=Photorhabdus australis TaxID=286156 RepID=UPI0030D8B033
MLHLIAVIDSRQCFRGICEETLSSDPLLLPLTALNASKRSVKKRFRATISKILPDLKREGRQIA